MKTIYLLPLVALLFSSCGHITPAPMCNADRWGRHYWSQWHAIHAGDSWNRTIQQRQCEHCGWRQDAGKCYW